MKLAPQAFFKLSAVSLAAVSFLVGCGAGLSGNFDPNVVFTEIAAPSTDVERNEIRVTKEVTINGLKYAIDFKPWAKSGDVIGTGTNNVWGEYIDANGNNMANSSLRSVTIGGKKVSYSPDHTTLLKYGSKLFSITQFEEYTGFMYITELAQNVITGALTAVATKPVNLSGILGGWDFCAGMPTPWGSHLGGEEYPEDARLLEAAADGTSDGYRQFLEYLGYDSTLTDANAKAASLATAVAKTSPYRIGYPVEVKITGESLGSGSFAANTQATKHYAMGRIAWELAYVMPNKKTVYAGDDSTNKGMFRFEADTAEDLSSGNLFIAKLTQTNAKSNTTAGGGEFTIDWIDLGKASSAQINSYILSGIKFSDMFDATIPATPYTTACANGFTPTYANNVYECLKLKTSNRLNMTEAEIKRAASRLEALRYGAMLGGTAEFRKFEGVTFDAKRNKLYIAMSAIGSGMSSSPALPGVSDDILVKSNVCGGVYQLDVNSNYVTTNMKPLLMGIPKTYTDRPIEAETGGGISQQTCDDAGIALPDNVTMGATDDMLIIGEDATTEHQNDFLWAYDLTTNKLTRLLSVPYGAEVTSPYYYRNINGWDYMTAVIQHPYIESDPSKGPDTTKGADRSAAKSLATRAQAGYIGPFPVVKR